MRKIIAILSLTIFFGCTNTKLASKANAIEPGQTKEQVLKILGTPGDKQFNGKDQAWQYCSTGIGGDKYVVVWFYDATVTGMTTYTNNVGEGNCDKFYKRIDWQSAPDRTIEIRNRN